MDRALDLAPCGYISIQDDGIVLTLNQTLADFLETSKDEVIGRSIENFLTIASCIFYNTHLFPLIKLQGHASEIFISLRGKNKKDVPVLLNGKRSKAETEFINEFILIPIHQRKEYEDKLLAAKRDAERAIQENEHLISIKKSLESRTEDLDQKNAMLMSMHDDLFQFSKVMSHDLQETLHKMNVFTDKLSIEEAGNLSGDGTRILQKILKASLKARSLIRGLHEFVQIRWGMEMTPVSLAKIIPEARARAEVHTGFSDFTLALPTYLPEVEGNEEQLTTVLYHLFVNSIQYRQPDHRLIISIFITQLKENKYRHTADKYKFTDHVKIVIQDNGSGFDNRLQDEVFNLFRKIHTNSPGLGIGLPLSRKIIKNHNGSISADSETGKGTSITIIIPLSTQE